MLLLIPRADGKFSTVGPQGALQVKGGKIEPTERAPIVDEVRGQAAHEIKQRLKESKRKE